MPFQLNGLPKLDIQLCRDDQPCWKQCETATEQKTLSCHYATCKEAYELLTTLHVKSNRTRSTNLPVHSTRGIERPVIFFPNLPDALLQTVYGLIVQSTKERQSRWGSHCQFGQSGHPSKQSSHTARRQLKASCAVLRIKQTSCDVSASTRCRAKPHCRRSSATPTSARHYSSVRTATPSIAQGGC